MLKFTPEMSCVTASPRCAGVATSPAGGVTEIVHLPRLTRKP
jgi:hypothetical protein